MKNKFLIIGILILFTFLISCTQLGIPVPGDSFPTEIPSTLQSNIVQLPTKAVNIVSTAAKAIPESPNENWQKADEYYGEYKTICGPVVDSNFASSSNGQPTFLNIGKPYPQDGRVTIIIWGENRNKFEYNPDSFYLGKNICVKGKIVEYNGNPEIEVTSPDQISIY